MKSAILLISILAGVMMSCGDPNVTVSNSEYEPKIVVSAILTPHQAPRLVRISRNIPLIGSFDKANLAISDAEVIITDMSSHIAYTLHFDTTTGIKSYFYSGNDWTVNYNKSYTLSVKAVVDGDSLWTTAVTTVPDSGFQVDSVSSDSIRYRQTDLNNDPAPFDFHIQRSPTASFYAVSMRALDADTATFVYDNPYFSVSRSDVLKDLEEFQNRQFEFENLPDGYGPYPLPVQWWAINFYGNYRAILYAGDKNFKDFFLTYGSVQDIDGSLYNPVFHLKGDGIGVFGSAVVDTAYFKILK